MRSFAHSRQHGKLPFFNRRFVISPHSTHGASTLTLYAMAFPYVVMTGRLHAQLRLTAYYVHRLAFPPMPLRCSEQALTSAPFGYPE